MLTPPISRYMTIVPATIAADASLGEAVAAMRATRVRHLPVLDGGRLVGIVSDRDLELLTSLRAEAVSPPPLTVRDAMTTQIYTVREDAPLVDVVATMAERRLGSAIVPSFRYDLLWREKVLRSVANLTRQDGITPDRGQWAVAAAASSSARDAATASTNACRSGRRCQSAEMPRCRVPA
jgi:acetoin utilization protein AcuB